MALKPRSGRLYLGILGLFVILAMLATSVYSQEAVNTSPKVEDLIAQLKKGPFMRLTANQIAEAGAVEAIPILRERFEAISPPAIDIALLKDDLLEMAMDKQVLAGALVRLGEKDESYWNFLLKNATEAVVSDAPFPLAFDATGKLIPKKLTPDFQAWSRARKISAETAAQNQIYRVPGFLLALAITADIRGISTLRKALSSPNYYIQNVGALGLALLQDKDSIPLIIGACVKAPAEIANVIARPLVFFEDPRAQEAAAKFIPDQPLLNSLRQRSHEKGPRGLIQ
jgi:hypothetical protein